MGLFISSVLWLHLSLNQNAHTVEFISPWSQTTLSLSEQQHKSWINTLWAMLLGYHLLRSCWGLTGDQFITWTLKLSTFKIWWWEHTNQPAATGWCVTINILIWTQKNTRLLNTMNSLSPSFKPMELMSRICTFSPAICQLSASIWPGFLFSFK